MTREGEECELHPCSHHEQLANHKNRTLIPGTVPVLEAIESIEIVDLGCGLRAGMNFNDGEQG